MRPEQQRRDVGMELVSTIKLETFFGVKGVGIGSKYAVDSFFSVIPNVSSTRRQRGERKIERRLQQSLVWELDMLRDHHYVSWW